MCMACTLGQSYLFFKFLFNPLGFGWRGEGEEDLWIIELKTSDWEACIILVTVILNEGDAGKACSVGGRHGSWFMLLSQVGRSFLPSFHRKEGKTYAEERGRCFRKGTKQTHCLFGLLVTEWTCRSLPSTGLLPAYIPPSSVYACLPSVNHVQLHSLSSLNTLFIPVTTPCTLHLFASLPLRWASTRRILECIISAFPMPSLCLAH